MKHFLAICAVLLSSCSGGNGPVAEEQIRRYQDTIETDCRRSSEADPRVLSSTAAPYCACVISAYRSGLSASDWQAAYRHGAAGNRQEELKIFEPHRPRLESCAQQFLKPSLAR